LSSPGNLSATHHAERVSEAGERALIERIRRRVPPAPRELLVGIGDDAAVAVPDRGALQVLTTDALVEGVHFDRRFSTPADIGYKALAVNVSDVAAMGATPRFALLSLMLPVDTTLDEVDGLLDGLLDLASATRVGLAGGNVTRSPGPLVIDVTVIGSVKPRKVLTRGGGRAGDVLYVTGQIGAAAAGLGWLRRQPAPQGRSMVSRPDQAALAECVARYCRPEPRARIGALLGRNRAASACMDLSDGLADAVAQVSSACGTGATIDVSLLPLHPGAREWFAQGGQDPVTACVAGGDDCELLFAVPRRTRSRLRTVLQEARGVSITRIGELTKDPAVGLARAGRLEPLPSGFVHF
jgi:thiamine-monophosphate kinase